MTKASPNTDSGVLRLKPHGDLIASTVEGERNRLMQALDSSTGPVVLDLAGVKEIDSLGITLILGTFKTCQKASRTFAVEGVSAEIHRVFKLFSLPKLFPISEAGTHGQPG